MGKNISDKVRKRVLDKYGGMCAYCGTQLNKNNFTVDHIDPKRRGEPIHKRGTDKEYNLNPCCKSCNSSKACFSIEVWRSEISKKYNRQLKESAGLRLLDRMNLIKFDNDIVFYFEKY